MSSNSMGKNFAKFKATGNPVYLAKTIQLLMHQRRTREFMYGVYCHLFHPPSKVKPHLHHPLNDMLETAQPFLVSKDILYKKDLIELFRAIREIDNVRQGLWLST
ncbi:hypothetical protein, partial [Candidatus Entotheonella palauensis]|uniref:hypothetical protein n=1 Tax=Candidatus Entotheonella palauensis TaxID=93172 RepID=UPI00117894EB